MSRLANSKGVYDLNARCNNATKNVDNTEITIFAGIPMPNQITRSGDNANIGAEPKSFI